MLDPRGGIARLLGGMSVVIKSGPNAGMRWSVSSFGRGYADGTFEAAKVGTIVRLVRPGERFWDVGAHKGYVSLAAARAAGPEGRVTAFEPAEANLRLLRRHLEWNGVDNVTVAPLALSDYDGEACFGGGSSLSYRLNGGDEIVRVRSIASLLERDGCEPPGFIKIDVEGAEAHVLRGAGDHLFAEDRIVLVAVHSRKAFDECSQVLADSGYRVVMSSEVSELASRNWTGRGDPDLLAIGPARSVSDADLELFTGGGSVLAGTDERELAPHGVQS